VHAKMARYITKLIDYNAYNKRNIRNEIYQELIKDYENHPYMLDLCCGVGVSTPNNEKCIGIDTSVEMINEAKELNKKYKQNYLVGNAENTYETIDFAQHFKDNYNDTSFSGFDIVTIFFAFHEIPQEARQDIILYHSKFTKDKLVIVDIDPSYKPSPSMVYGEPYLFDYKQNIKKDLLFAKEDIIINNHVIMWTFEL
jgi:SAM-dependent methyltransferase